MDLLEVDPKLFITCRLCIEDTGVYQIVPAIQCQIKYCFDIDVESFDGLPQLLCKKCHTLLSEYATLKKTFIEKQETLKQKIILKKEVTTPPDESIITKNSITNTSPTEAKDQKKKFTKAKRRKRILSTSSTDTETSKKGRKLNRKNVSNKSWPGWRKQYKRYYVCKICSLMFKDKKSVQNHYDSHTNIRNSHYNILNAKCMVSLSKLDNKPNITGLENTVVFSKNRITQDDENDSYFIVYITKGKHYKSDSSEDEVLAPSKQKNRNRLDSLSSNETVLISNNKSPEEFDVKGPTNATSPKIDIKSCESKDTPICIDLDDSSDSNMDTSQFTKENSSNSLKIDMKTIENIVNVCRNKYEMRLKKSLLTENDSSRAQMDLQLKHKLLNFGRKNINVAGFNSTGLLRYLEYKNLNIIWEPVSPKKAQSASREHNFVRVGAIMMNNEQRAYDETGWTDVELTVEKEHFNESVPVSSTLNLISAGMSVLVSTPKTDGVNQIVLSDVRSIEETNSKKLLNVNPVANPKQLLPKKPSTHDAKSLFPKQDADKKIFVLQMNETIAQMSEPDLVMPVITSTTSLAADNNNETKKKDPETANGPNKNIVDKPVPRIKVKPVSELMNPPKVTTDHQNSIWNYNQIQNGTGVSENPVNLFVPNTLVSQIQSQSMPMSVGGSSNEVAKTNSDYIVLDTVEMPNTKTRSPFEYFKDLLFLHGLVLIEANSDITKEFTCLLKFKVQFKQENKSNPVSLCLSLHCSGNKFCMCIKDINHINIHIVKMSANWQWEIIKVYQGDVSTKILLNAQKAGQIIYKSTNTFLCLLKSITHKLEQ